MSDKNENQTDEKKASVETAKKSKSFEEVHAKEIAARMKAGLPRVDAIAVTKQQALENKNKPAKASK